VVLSARSLPAPFPVATFLTAVFLATMGAELLHLLPLLRRQFTANRQQVASIRLFQLRPRLRHLVDLRQYL
jgi:hypothetical protein